MLLVLRRTAPVKLEAADGCPTIVFFSFRLPCKPISRFLQSRAGTQQLTAGDVVRQEGPPSLTGLTWATSVNESVSFCFNLSIAYTEGEDRQYADIFGYFDDQSNSLFFYFLNIIYFKWAADYKGSWHMAWTQHQCLLTKKKAILTTDAAPTM